MSQPAIGARSHVSPREVSTSQNGNPCSMTSMPPRRGTGLTSQAGHPRVVDRRRHPAHAQRRHRTGEPRTRCRARERTATGRSWPRCQPPRQPCRVEGWITELVAHDRHGAGDWSSIKVSRDHGQSVKVPILARHLMTTLPLSDGTLPVCAQPRILQAPNHDERLNILRDEGGMGLHSSRRSWLRTTSRLLS